ncbi:substrate-binding periplasmic protein [Psychrobium sp. nBUS_13]|uniref:substrate-binding periplasmic protein n=1 Tax=Psychrobium sp. nBUS_13 TaxID=3395319 RepID=UPI003EBCE1EF
MYSKILKYIVILFCFYCGSLLAKPITVVTEYLPPFQIKKEDGSLSGYSTAVVNRLFELTDLRSTVYVLPWARAFLMAKKEPNVLIYSMFRTKERESQFQWVGNLQTQHFYLWGLKKNFSQPLVSLEEAKAYRISTSKGYSADYFLKANGFTNVSLTSRYTQNVGMLFKERVDIISGPALLLKYMVADLGYDATKLQRLHEVKELNKDMSIAFSKDTDPKLVRRFKIAFNYLEKTGELDNIKRQWGITKY